MYLNDKNEKEKEELIVQLREQGEEMDEAALLANM